jgi:hypothetical protein
MELAWLGIFLLAGMGSAAVLTGFSWLKYFLFRAAIMMGMTFATGAFCAAVLDDMFGYRRNYIIDELYAEGGWQLLLLMAAPALHVAFFALDLGASKVGSLVENRSLRRRVVGLLFLLFYGLIAAFWRPSGYPAREMAVVLPVGFSLVTVMVLGLQAILEPPLNLVAVVMPMVKRGFAGRVAGRFFYPGWPSGVCWIFTVLVMLALAGVVGISLYYQEYPEQFAYRFSDRNASEMVTAFGATFGMLPVPLVLWQLFLRRRLPWHFGIYGLLLAGVCALALGLGVAASSTNAAALKLGLPIPAMGLAWHLHSHERYRGYDELSADQYLNWDYQAIMIFTAAGTVVWWLLAVLLALRAFRETREVEREAAGLLRAARDQAVT